MLTSSEQQLFERLKALQNRLPDYGRSWLGELRETGLKRFVELGIPSRKSEQWKYTNIKPVVEKDYWHRAIAERSVGAGDLAPFELAGLDAIRLVFLNGHFSAELSDTGGETQGLTIEPLSDAFTREEPTLARLGTLSRNANSPFSEINTGLADQGAVILVDDGQAVQRPVNVLFVNAGSPGLFSAHPRLLICVGKNSRLDVIEQYVTLKAAGEPLNNSVTEIFLAEGARCRYSKLLQEAGDTVTIGGTYVRQSGNSDFESHTICLGGGLLRNDLNVMLAEPGASCRLNGIYLASQRQHIDNHTVIEHIAPHCNSREFYKGLINGRAHAVFNGRIHIHPGAQQSNAELSNKNLLLSAMAEIDTKPELEIYADDVKCSHGATVGE
ncbi:MAG TPA: SufD family Fe-S cluster assembly protein, partial [Gammaproteobacteria bacterium]